MDASLSGIVTLLLWLASAAGSATAAAWAYDRTLVRLPAQAGAYFQDARVRGYLLPMAAAVIASVAAQLVVPAQTLAGTAYAPLIDALLTQVLPGVVGWVAATRAMAWAVEGPA